MKIIQFAFMLLFLVGCSSDETSNAAGLQSKNTGTATPSMNEPGVALHKAVVQEMIQVDNYTYLRLKEGEAESWLAGPTIQVKVGETVYYQNGMLMTNFQSKELKRTFDNILFVDKISTDPEAFSSKAAPQSSIPADHMNMQEKMSANTPATGASKEPVKQDVKIEKPNNGLSIAEILKNPKSFEGKKVLVKGKVTKYTGGVMGKNWVHIQDGTTYDNKFEIVITTSSEVKDGDTVTFEGPLTLNKDLGFGYFFEVLMEDAKLLK